MKNSRAPFSLSEQSETSPLSCQTRKLLSFSPAAQGTKASEKKDRAPRGSTLSNKHPHIDVRMDVCVYGWGVLCLFAYGSFLIHAGTSEYKRERERESRKARRPTQPQRGWKVWLCVYMYKCGWVYIGIYVYIVTCTRGCGKATQSHSPFPLYFFRRVFFISPLSPSLSLAVWGSRVVNLFNCRFPGHVARAGDFFFGRSRKSSTLLNDI